MANNADAALDGAAMSMVRREGRSAYANGLDEVLSQILPDNEANLIKLVQLMPRIRERLEIGRENKDALNHAVQLLNTTEQMINSLTVTDAEGYTTDLKRVLQGVETEEEINQIMTAWMNENVVKLVEVLRSIRDLVGTRVE